ncbi:MAG TPA: GNAT family N-acetyltransferase [Candidatus Binatia bacterium]
MAAAVDIVPFAPPHQDGVVAVILPIQRDEFGIPITLADQPDLQDIPGFYRCGAGDFWVAIAAGEVVGTIALLDIGNGEAALRKMFVKPPFRGAEPGVAGRLLDVLLRHCRARGIREVYLGTTAKFLAAHRFYEKRGFVVIDKLALPPAFPVMSVDTRFYRLDVG